MSNPLKAIICGYEKSGTTLLNEILRRHPDMDSGFEGGFLLGDSPRDFPQIKPYYGFFRKTWELSREDMRYISDTDDWAESYRRARERTPIIKNKASHLFDKTPIYMLYLHDVLNKMPDVPCIVNVRDPRALMLSWARWSGFKSDPERWILENLEHNCERYLSYARGYSEAQACHGDRILLNQFEALCEDPPFHLARIFDFLGLEFKETYMSFSSKHFVYGTTVSKEYVYPYLSVLSEETCRKILAGTAQYSQWFYQPVG